MLLAYRAGDDDGDDDAESRPEGGLVGDKMIRKALRIKELCSQRGTDPTVSLRGF